MGLWIMDQMTPEQQRQRMELAKDVGRIYGDETIKILDQLTDGQLQMAQREGETSPYLADGSFQRTLQRMSERTEHVLRRIKRPGEKKKELAKRLHMREDTLSRSTSRKNSRKLTRNQVLTILFELQPRPTCDQADHLLMELGHPGLFIRTAKKKVNQRNMMLRKILEYDPTGQCPVRGWSVYANLVLEKTGMDCLFKSAEDETEILPKNHHVLVAQWQEEVMCLDEAEYAWLPKQLFNRFVERIGQDYYGGIGPAEEKLAEAAKADINRVKAIRRTAKEEPEAIDRRTLLPMLVSMGCTLQEANMILLLYDKELLYPNRNDEEELEWVRAFRLNEAKNKKN